MWCSFAFNALQNIYILLQVSLGCFSDSLAHLETKICAFFFSALTEVQSICQESTVCLWRCECEIWSA